MVIIGIDCAVQPKRTGVAIAQYDAGAVTLQDAWLGNDQLADNLATIIHDSGTCLLALDAPLGWPGALGHNLVGHQAGQPLTTDPEHLFSRETDRFVRARINKRPLDVGADRIARTAASALRLLTNLRDRTGQPIPLAWQPNLPRGAHAIEVYPAATLIGRGHSVPRYKKPADHKGRQTILTWLEKDIRINCSTETLEQSADVLDSAICVRAAADFLDGLTYPSPNDDRARKEGWIWFHKGRDNSAA